MTKTLFVKISDEDYKNIKRQSVRPAKLAENFLFNIGKRNDLINIQQNIFPTYSPQIEKPKETITILKPVEPEKDYETFYNSKGEHINFPNSIFNGMTLEEKNNWLKERGWLLNKPDEPWKKLNISEEEFCKRKAQLEKDIDEAKNDEIFFGGGMEPPRPLSECLDIPQTHNTIYKEKLETFDEKIERIAKEQKEQSEPKLTKKEKERLEQIELGKKFGKDPNKYTFVDVTPEMLTEDGWTKEQIAEYMKNKK